MLLLVNPLEERSHRYIARDDLPSSSGESAVRYGWQHESKATTAPTHCPACTECPRWIRANFLARRRHVMALMGLPVISSCEVDACYYNKDEQCHAAAINVGASHPECDTFIRQQGAIGRNGTGVVGACHVAQCKWNDDLMCGASKIDVRYHGNHADCGTFEARA